MLDNTLIESALQLTWKSMEDMEECISYTNCCWHHPSCSCEDHNEYEFSIEKFCYYLLSPEFIEKYDKIEYPRVWSCRTCMYFWLAIYEYQRRDEKYPGWNETPLIELLNKI